MDLSKRRKWITLRPPPKPLLPDGRFDGTPEALRYLCYTRRDSFESFAAEEVLAKYSIPLPATA